MQCLIIDDDPIICDLLKHFCAKIDQISAVTTTNSGFESINLINQNSFDIIFLDYHLPDVTGEEILPLIPPHTAVIIITSNEQFGAASYNYDQIVDFLVKPIDYARFAKGILKATKYLSQNLASVDQDPLFIKDGNRLVKISLPDVLYIKSAANYVQFVLQNRKVMSLGTLKDLEQKLPDNFQRIHRSFIANIHKVDSIGTGHVMINGEELSVSERYEEPLLNKIKLLQ